MPFSSDRLEVQITNSIAKIDPAVWQQLSVGRPFASYDWYHFGEVILNQAKPVYLLISCSGEPIARAVFWLKPQEAIPVRSAAIRYVVNALIRRWPLMICQTPLVSSATSLIVPPSGPLRQAVLRAIYEAARMLAQKHKASFLIFDYLTGQSMQWPWPAGLTQVVIPDPGTRLQIIWSSFEAYLDSLSTKTRRSYRHNRNRAERKGIEITRHRRVPQVELDEGMRLIRSVETHYQTGHTPWARRLLAHGHQSQAIWLAARIEGRLVGCCLCLRDGPYWYPTLLGRDYKADYVYLALFYELLRCSIEEGAQVLLGGSGAYDLKRRHNFEMLEDNYALVWAANAFLQWSMHRLV